MERPVQGLRGRGDVRRDRARQQPADAWAERSPMRASSTSATAFRIAVWLEGAGRRLQAGEYRFDAPMTPRAVVDKIARGDVFLRPITFREGLTIRQMAAIFESEGFGTADEFVAAASKPGPIRELDPQARDLEGYLFPDTYTLPRRTTADDLVARMVARFEKALTPETATAGGGARPERPRARHARVARREGDRQGRGAAARRGGLRQPAEDRHGAAVRSDGHLRARARRALHGQPHARGPAVRLAVQHLPLCRPAARPDCRARARRRSRPPPIRPTCRTCIS